MNAILSSIREEFQTMLSGKAVPYHKAAWAMAVGTAFFFSVLTSHGIAFESNIAVIDADGSNFSSQLIEQINTSPYIKVSEVLHNTVKPEDLLHHDRNVGVLYLPSGLEKTTTRNDHSFNVGFFADYSNIAQNAQTISSLQEQIPKMAPSSASSSGLSLVSRELFNPTKASSTIFTATFVIFLSSIFFGITTLMLIGRLKISGKWQTEVLPQGPLALIARLIPYSFIYTTVITVVLAALTVFGQLRFAGNYLAFVPSIFLTGMNIGLIGYILCWKTTSPAQGVSRMILIVPPGFVMSGALMTTAFFDPILVSVKWLWPLTWLYSFWRDFAIRGATLPQMLTFYGIFFIYTAILTSLVTWLFAKEVKAIITTPQILSQHTQATKE